MVAVRNSTILTVLQGPLRGLQSTVGVAIIVKKCL